MSLEQEREGNDVLKKVRDNIETFWWRFLWRFLFMIYTLPTNVQLLQNSDLFGTGNESDSESEGGSQPVVNHQRSSPEKWEEEREEEGSPLPEDGAKKKRKRKESNKMPKVRREGGGGEK